MRLDRIGKNGRPSKRALSEATMEDERKSPAVLRERAEKCRLARGIADTVASEQLARFAEEL
jgi:hypothetical protein